LVDEDSEAYYFKRHTSKDVLRIPKSRVRARAFEDPNTPIVGLSIMGIGLVATIALYAAQDCSEEADFCEFGRDLTVLGGLGVMTLGLIVAIVEHAIKRRHTSWTWERTAQSTPPEPGVPTLRLGGAGLALTW
jgi:hypothetical protein